MKRILIPLAQYQTYVTAARRLGQKLGQRAPSPVTLIRHELGHRRPRLIADEYLDSIGWRRRRLQPRVAQARAASLVERCLRRNGSLAPEPGRN